MTTTPIPARTDNRRLNMANGFALSSALYTVTRVGVADLLQGQKNGKLLVVDSVVPEDSGPHFSKLLDLEMLLMPGGRKRTESEFRALFARGGFEITRIVPSRRGEGVIAARPW
jgi:hypothetical protein